MPTVNEIMKAVARGCGDALYGSGDPRFALCTKERLAYVLNKAQYDFVRRTGCTTDEYSFALKERESEYYFNDNCIRPLEIFYRNRKVWSIIDSETKSNLGRTPGTSNEQMTYSVLKGKNNNGMLRITPLPSSDSPATTLDGDINSTATSIVVADVDDFSDSVGELLIGSEIISFKDKTTSTLTFSVPTNGRGYQNTTAASHTDGDAVTLLEVKVVHIRRPADLSEDNLSAVPEIPVEYHCALEEYAKWEILQLIDTGLAAMHKNEYEKIVLECMSEYLGTDDMLDLKTANLLWGNVGEPVTVSNWDESYYDA